MPAAIVTQSQRVVPLSNQPDKCADQRLCWTASITFEAVGDSIRLSVNSSDGPNQQQFDVVRGMFVFFRGRADSGSGLKAWLEIQIPITGQRWDIGTPDGDSAWHSTSLSVPVFMPATGEIVVTLKQGNIPENGDCIFILTNFDVQPYSASSLTDNGVG